MQVNTLFSFSGLFSSRQMVCGLLAYALGAAIAPAVQAQDVLTAVNTIFYNRLENRLRYQEAVLPVGRRARKQFLPLGKRTVVLESLQTLGSNKATYGLREDYIVSGTVHNPLSISKARYRLDANYAVEGRQLAWGLFHNYPTDEAVEAAEFLLVQEFSPSDLLRLQPGNAQSGQVVYVKNARVGFNGDTLERVWELGASSSTEGHG